MNGTDIPTLNIYGSSGIAPGPGTGVYSFPRDIDAVKSRMQDVIENKAEIIADLAGQGFELSDAANLLPIYCHRYLVCTDDPNSSVVLSIVVGDVDAVVYADSLQEYLEREFLRE